MTAEPLLRVRDLRVGFGPAASRLMAVDGISFDINDSEVVGLVGESGSGKSVTALALMRLLGSRAQIEAASACFRGKELLALDERGLRAIRGARVGMVFQDPTAALNPVLRIGEQIEEAAEAHGEMARKASHARAVELLTAVGIPDPENRLRSYPHELSGGMRQRVMIAMALANNPDLLIADEPTTALDVTIQAQILELILDVNRRFGTAILLITHNMGIVARYCERALVMYAGRVVEQGPVQTLFRHAKHPYTLGLLQSVPRLDEERREQLLSIEGQPPTLERRPNGCPFHPRCRYAIDRCRSEIPGLHHHDLHHQAACWVTEAGLELRSGENAAQGVTSSHERRVPYAESVERLADKGPLLEIENLSKHFRLRAGGLSRDTRTVRAVDNVSLSIKRGETLGLVGESGCGKSTLGRTVLHVHPPTAGAIRFNGTDLTQLAGRQLRRLRRELQMIFQDPYSSLDPRMAVGAIVAEPMAIHALVPRGDRSQRVAGLLDMVGLSPSLQARYPFELSGGQRQRVAIARALATGPSLVVCDEVVSALDVSLQAQVINLLLKLQAELKMAYLFIGHDLAVVRHVSNRIAVMYLGRVVELGESRDVCARPLHPYTVSLISASPIPDPDRRDQQRLVLEGDVPSPDAPPRGCPFHTRCPIGPLRYAERKICLEEAPALKEHETGRWAACHFAGTLEVSRPGGSARPVERSA